MSVYLIGSGDFVTEVRRWVVDTFSETFADDPQERNHRFLEEALETVQAFGCTKEEALMLVNHVYSRPAGQPRQEVGGSMMTLAALCAAHHIGMEECAWEELQRCWERAEQIKYKQREKPRMPKEKSP